MPARAPFAAKIGAERASLAAGPPARRRGRESLQDKIERAGAISARLAENYPGLECPLAHRNAFELLVAVILSAQCTDAAVNRVTPALFERFPAPAALADAAQADIEALIRRLGLFRAKARSLKRCAQQLVEEFGGQVPPSMQDLTRLAGVGRKTANVIRGHAFAQPGIAVDTHCRRVARRLGLTRRQDPVTIEHDLARLLPPKGWTEFSHRLILHGRAVCRARKPRCGSCPLFHLCPSRSSAAPAT